MRLLYQFITTFWTWLQTLKSFRRPLLLIPFLAYGALEVLLILALLSFYTSPFKFFLPPLYTHFFGERALHYPDVFLLLPDLFARASLVFGVIFGPLLLGFATRAFADYYVADKFSLSESFRVCLRKFPSLFVISVFSTVAVIGAGIFGGFVGRDIIAKVFSSWPLIIAVRFIIAVAIEALLIYAVAFVVLRNENLLKGILFSIRKAALNPVASWLLVAVPVLLYYPVRFASSRSALLVQKFNPEIVAAVLIGGVILTVFSNFILVGGITRYFLIEEER